MTTEFDPSKLSISLWTEAVWESRLSEQGYVINNYLNVGLYYDDKFVDKSKVILPLDMS